MDTADLVQRLREQRLTTLALADQVHEDRWREPLLPGGNSLHDVLAHLLGWDEWATAVFDISTVRPLPPALMDALDDVDGYNARSQKRYAGLSRDDLLTGLQSATPRVLASAMNPSVNQGIIQATGPAVSPTLNQQSGEGTARWDERRIAELGEIWAAMIGRTGDGPRPPSVKGLLRMLYEHEKAHDDEISQTLGITADLDRFKQDGQDGEGTGEDAEES
jgi:hypothetical protein